jgi:hypothetical protein
MAAWLTVRGRKFVGGRELLAFDTWSGEIFWRDHKTHHGSHHRPDLVKIRAYGRPIAVEVELAQQSVGRLRATLYGTPYGARPASKTNGVFYVCGDEDGRARIRKVADAAGYFSSDDPGSCLSCSKRSRPRRSRQARRSGVRLTVAGL